MKKCTHKRAASRARQRSLAAEVKRLRKAAAALQRQAVLAGRAEAAARRREAEAVRNLIRACVRNVALCEELVKAGLRQEWGTS